MKLDLGCGPNKREGFTGVDCRQFQKDGADVVDIVFDLREPWGWANSSVEEIHASHFIEHLEPLERAHVVNEAWRVLQPAGKLTIITPHWSSCRAYGDLTHKWPPVCEFWFNYLDREWRKTQAPHNDFYSCHFAATWGYNVHPQFAVKSMEAQQFAMQFYKEACQDMIATLTKKE